MKKETNKLPPKDRRKAKKVLDLFAYHEYRGRGYKWINGAFSHAKVKEVDEDFIHIVLKIGVQDGATNSVSKENYRLARDVLAQDTPANKKMYLIEAE